MNSTNRHIALNCKYKEISLYKRLHVYLSVCLSVCNLLVTKMLVTHLHVSHRPPCYSNTSLLVTLAFWISLSNSLRSWWSPLLLMVTSADVMPIFRAPITRGRGQKRRPVPATGHNIRERGPRSGLGTCHDPRKWDYFLSDRDGRRLASGGQHC